MKRIFIFLIFFIAFGITFFNNLILAQTLAENHQVNAFSIKKILINDNDISLNTLLNEGIVLDIKNLEISQQNKFTLPIYIFFDNGSIKKTNYDLIISKPNEIISPTLTQTNTPTQIPLTITPTITPNNKQYNLESGIEGFYLKAKTERTDKLNNDSNFRTRVISELNKNKVNFLILGLGKDGLSVYLIKILSYDVATKNLSMITLPRDLMTPEIVKEAQIKKIDVYKTSLNQALIIGSLNKDKIDSNGFKFFQNVIENAIGLSIDYIAIQDYQWVEKYINGKIKNIPFSLFYKSNKENFPIVKNNISVSVNDFGGVVNSSIIDVSGTALLKMNNKDGFTNEPLFYWENLRKAIFNSLIK